MAIPVGGSVGPARAGVFLSDKATGAPLSGVLMFAAAELSVTPPTGSGGASSTARVPLGLLGSDHAGYVSWDLASLSREATRLAGLNNTVQLEHLWVSLNGPLESVFDLAANAGPLDESLLVRLAVDPAAVYRDPRPGFPSMQSPSLVDWTLSPGSFAYMPAELVGADGCETLLPSNVATQKFQLYQIIQVPNEVATLTPPLAPADGTSTSTPAPVALVVTYDVTWIPVGHGLGQITYSLPLAPGEEVQLAVVDWSRTSQDSRSEETTLTDRLDHDELRDRTVSEVVNASIHDWQAGGSILGGIAGAASGGGGLVGGLLGASGKGSGSIGGGYATTTGDRNISSDTVQNLRDQFTQHSTNLRDLRSTVVVQSSQAESATAQTRVVRNHNHAHALTMLYYEVLRHYRVIVERGSVRPAVLLSEIPISFTPANPKDPGDIAGVMATISRYRSLLESGLLVPDLAPGFDAVEKFVAWSELNDETALPGDPGSIKFTQFNMFFTHGGLTNTTSDVPTNVTVIYAKPGDTTGQQVPDALFVPGTGNPKLEHPHDFCDGGPDVVELNGAPANGLSAGYWRDLRTFSIRLSPPSSGTSHNDAVEVTSVKVVGIDTAGYSHVLLDSTDYHKFNVDDSQPWPLPAIQAPPAQQQLTPTQRLSDDENLARVRLQHHLANNSDYYNRLIRLNEDPNARIDRLGGHQLALGGQAKPLFQAIENRALDVYGGATAFAIDPGLFGVGQSPMTLPEVAPARVEDVISLPTRGVFAEAKLGHCNAAEVIDNTRFWDWQKSPDPDKAPGIADVSTNTREVTVSTTPTAFPTSVVSIQQPPAAPDPVALAAAMKVLGQGNIFTDMSTQSEVAAILQALIKENSGGQDTGSGSTPPGKTGPGTNPGGPGTNPGGPGTSTGGTGAGTTPPGKQAKELDLVQAVALDGPPEHSPQPPQLLGPTTRSVVVSIPPVVYGPGGAGDETGAFSVLARQDGKPDLLVDNVRPGTTGIVLAGDIDATKPLTLSVNGTTSHYIWQLDATENLPQPVAGPLAWYAEGTLTVPTLPAVQQSYGYQVVRETAHKVVSVSRGDLAKGVVGAVAAQAGVSVEQLVSIGSAFVVPAQVTPPAGSGGQGGGGIGIGIGGGNPGGGDEPPSTVTGEVEYFTGRLLVIPAGTGHNQP